MAKKVKKRANLYIGTSGWVYNHWKGIFYPEDLSQREWLKFYTEHFDTVELNASFYHLPKPQTFSNWREAVGENFIFAVKASRYITHVKKLKDPKEPWGRFIDSAKNLKEKLGPILFQLPPNFKANLERIENFLKILSPKKYLYVLEPRHPSWFKEEVYQILKKYQIALCIGDSPNWPSEKVITSDFVYLRFHGGQFLYSSNYSTKELKKWAKDIKEWLKRGFDVYAYFNNDAEGYAVENAKTLSKLLTKQENGK